MSQLSTPRLDLFVPSREALEVSAKGRAQLAAALARPVATDWPPRHWEQPVVEWLSEKILADPREPFWRPWFIALQGGPVVGTCGCKGPPDDAGAIEIGYSVVDSHWRQGIASEAVAALIRWILRDARVRVIRAHTLVGDPASSGVLRRNGFFHTATIDDPADGRVDRFELPRK